MTLKKRLIMAFLLILLLPTFMVLAAVLISLNSPESGINPDTGFLIVSWPQAITIMVLIICVTAIVLVLWLYRSIVMPLNTLTEATKQIKEGNLDFSIPTDQNSTDELTVLCGDFEEMRIKLKTQIDARLQYEQDTVDLISNISHDLKTPLTSIKGYTEGILDGVADSPEKRQKYLRTIYTKASDMTVLVDELAFYSKIDINVIPYNFTNLKIDHFLDDCVEEMSLDTEIKNISLDYVSHVKHGQCIMADPEQLRRVVSNCISNAVKYMGKDSGYIRLATSDEGDYVRVSVTDSGVGISEEDLPYIFDRFFRTDASRNSRKGGTGLGLAIAKKIVEDHTGNIYATSILGEGTTISFTLLKEEAAKIDPELGELVNKNRARYKKVTEKSVTDWNEIKNATQNDENSVLAAEKNIIKAAEENQKQKENREKRRAEREKRKTKIVDLEAKAQQLKTEIETREVEDIVNVTGPEIPKNINSKTPLFGSSGLNQAVPSAESAKEASAKAESDKEAAAKAESVKETVAKAESVKETAAKAESVKETAAKAESDKDAASKTDNTAKTSDTSKTDRKKKQSDNAINKNDNDTKKAASKKKKKKH